MFHDFSATGLLTAVRRAFALHRHPADWLAAATFGLQWLLPQAQVHWQRVTQPGLALPFLAAWIATRIPMSIERDKKSPSP